MIKKKLACMAAAMAVCGTLLAGASDYTILEKAEKVETTVYGSTQTGALADRIDSLDQTLYGQKDNRDNIESRTDYVYKNVYGNEGSDLSMLAAVNLMQWKYSGQVTHDSLIGRMSAMEEAISGKVGTGSLDGRIAVMRRFLLNNEKFVSTAVTIPMDTIVHIKTLEPLNSKVNKKNEIVHFTVAEDVMIGGIVAIPKGMEFEGTVTEVRKAGHFGRDGKMMISYGAVQAVDGSPVALTIGEKSKEEYERTAGAVGASAAGAIILGPIGLVGGLFVNGSNVDIPQGTAMYVQTKEEVTVIGFTEIPDNTPTADRVARGVATDSDKVVPGDKASTAVLTAGMPKSGTTVPTAAANAKPVDIGEAAASEPAGNAQAVVTVTPNTNNA